MRPRRIEPGPGQESVWDYPRPPRLERSDRQVEIRFAGILLAQTRRAFRLLETSHPPTRYLPPEDVHREHLVAIPRTSFCEFKGEARHFDIQVGDAVARGAAWCYPHPTGRYAELADHLAFYAAPMEGCFVDGHQVEPQPGEFYGGWITPDVVGPFKGGPGSWGW